ncbi:MAG: SUKH-4 family immunity protein, partial [Gimesia sp.]|nr:SUKH-4 family immunity protein [Gimesia sp.]
FLDFKTPASGPLPNVAESWQQGAGFRRYRIIGSNGSGDPVCIDEVENGQVVYLNHDFNFKRVLINSSIPALAESLVVYREFIREVQKRNGEDAWLDGDIPEDVLESIDGELKRIDPAGMQPGCFWSFELERLLEEQE